MTYVADESAFGGDILGGYIKRIVEDEIELDLSLFGAVVLRGPKWCGKTTTARVHCSSEISMTDPSGDFANRRMAELDPSGAISGRRPMLIDEWQEVPKIWDAVRFECDLSGEPGLYILAGSATPRDADGPMHSGVGRFSIIRMDTMTLLESGASSGAVSLRAIMGGAACGVHAGSMSGLAAVAEAVCRGGWPQSSGADVERAMRLASRYVSLIAESDISKVDGVRRDPDKVARLIRSLARNESTLAGTGALIADMGGDVSRSTVSQYLSILRRMHVVDDIPAWSPALRSPIRLRESAKRHLADPSIAAAAMGADPVSLSRDPKTLGLLFESLVLHDLAVYARAIGARVFHYHDASDLEVDAIIEKRDGEWAAVEVKLGSAQIEDGVRNLLRLERKMVERGERAPVAKCVVIGFGPPSHTAEGGVSVIPIDTLGV